MLIKSHFYFLNFITIENVFSSYFPCCTNASQVLSTLEETVFLWVLGCQLPIMKLILAIDSQVYRACLALAKKISPTTQLCCSSQLFMFLANLTI